jgi:hypothetical protein
MTFIYVCSCGTRRTLAEDELGVPVRCRYCDGWSTPTRSTVTNGDPDLANSTSPESGAPVVRPTGKSLARMTGSRMERVISCERVPEGRRLRAFQEAVDRALKSLVSRYPQVQGFSVKLYKNLPAFAPAYYIGTRDRVKVRRGWTFGLDALLDATAKPMRFSLGMSEPDFVGPLSALTPPRDLPGQVALLGFNSPLAARQGTASRYEGARV